MTKSTKILHDSYGKYNPTSVRESCLEALKHRSVVQAYKKGGINLTIKDKHRRAATINAVVEQCRVKLESTEAYQKYAHQELSQVIQINNDALQKSKDINAYPQFKDQFAKDAQRWQQEQARQQMQQTQS